MSINLVLDRLVAFHDFRGFPVLAVRYAILFNKVLTLLAASILAVSLELSYDVSVSS